MHRIGKEHIGAFLEHIARKHVYSTSVICFYEPSVPESFKAGIYNKEMAFDSKDCKKMCKQG